MAAPILVPLRNRSGEIVAHVTMDAEDAALTEKRWYLGSKGYANRIEGHGPGARTVYLHREILGLVPGDGLKGDHKDRNRLDCRRGNLRILPEGVNQQNRSATRGTASRHRGVSWNSDKGKWRATAQLSGERHHLGYFLDEEEAAGVARDWRAKHMPYSIEVAA